MSFRAQLSSDHASILLETALCLPFYFVLLIFLVDVPQIMAHRQSLMGLARLHADVKSRNMGLASMLNEDFCKTLFWEQPMRIQRVELIDSQKEAIVDPGITSTLANKLDTSIFNSFQSNAFLDMINFLTQDIFESILTGKSIENFFDKVFKTDVFYRSRPRIAIHTILPPDFYAVVMNIEADKNLYVNCPYDCWQPSGNSAQIANPTAYGKIGEQINKIIGWMGSFFSLPSLSFADT